MQNLHDKKRDIKDLVLGLGNNSMKKDEKLTSC